MKFNLLYIALVFFSVNAKSQIINPEYDKQFALQVKQIDEFIERFNFDTTGQNLLKEFLDQNNLTNRDTFNRAFFLKTLFNHEGALNLTTAKEFISIVDNSPHPLYLNFYDNNWFAHLECDFFLLGKPHKIQVIMINQVKEKQISKWVIYSVKSDLFSIPEIEDSTKIFNPMSHAINFMTMDKALVDRNNSTNYYGKNFIPDPLSQFYFLTRNKILTFHKINQISYLFFQIPNYFFKVEYFRRQSNNSGWLISHIEKMGIKEKLEYKSKNLNIDE